MSISKYKISVAMTTYNGQKYIRKQIESLLHQSILPDEIVISDDSSTDGTVEESLEVFNEFNYKNYVILRNEKNLGYKKNFYQSIENTSGDIIFLCDQDDIWLEHKLESMINIFAENEKVLSLNGSFTLIDAHDQPIEYVCHRGFVNNDLLKGDYPSGEAKTVPYDTVLRYNISPGCTMAFRKEIKTLFLNGTTHDLPHDWEINIIAAMKDGLYFYNKPVIKYRIHEKNTLGMNTDDSISQFEFKGNIDFRKAALKDRVILKKVAVQRYKQLKGSQKQKKVLKRVLKYDDLRMRCVCDHKLSAWLPLFFLTVRMWDGKHVRFKTLFGDFYYIFKR